VTGSQHEQKESSEKNLSEIKPIDDFLPSSKFGEDVVVLEPEVCDSICANSDEPARGGRQGLAPALHHEGLPGACWRRGELERLLTLLMNCGLAKDKLGFVLCSSGHCRWGPQRLCHWGGCWRTGSCSEGTLA